MKKQHRSLAEYVSDTDVMREVKERLAALKPYQKQWLANYDRIIMDNNKRKRPSRKTKDLQHVSAKRIKAILSRQHNYYIEGELPFYGHAGVIRDTWHLLLGEYPYHLERQAEAAKNRLRVEEPFDIY